MKTTLFMPIKMNNERTPGKNVKQFDDGTPLLQVPLNTAIRAKEEGFVDRVIVYCSREEIKQYIPNQVEFIQRPTYLDSQETKCGDIIEAFINTVSSDIYVMYHATSPFISKQHLIRCIDAVKSGKYDSCKYRWFRALCTVV